MPRNELTPESRKELSRRLLAAKKRSGVKNLTKADGVAMLDGWTSSRGACLEFQVAEILRHYGLAEVRTVKEWLDGAPKAA